MREGTDQNPAGVCPPFMPEYAGKGESFMVIPQHVAIILDGNGRWAKSKGMPRNYGHAQDHRVRL